MHFLALVTSQNKTMLMFANLIQVKWQKIYLWLPVLITYLTESAVHYSFSKLIKTWGQITSMSASFNYKVFRKQFII